MRVSCLAGLLLVVASGSAAGQANRPESAPPMAAGMSMAPPRAFVWPPPDSSAILHFLNRLTFGPTLLDFEYVRSMGFRRWLDEQLQPARINDPVQNRVRAQFWEAFAPPADLYRHFPQPQAVGRVGGRADSTMDPRPGMDRSTAQPLNRQGPRQLGAAVVMATLARHAQSERQLHEVMTDFWFNHFNVFIGKQAARWLTGDYVERAIRPNALGSFETLLKAVARHPAMLVYLDNSQSVAPGSQPPAMARRALQRMPDEVQRRMPTGINENYARELLELHTLGVDGGYTQQDVQAVARILTGWSIVGPGQPNAMGNRRVLGRDRVPLTFEFHDWAHDRGQKVVLGTVFPAGRMEDEGERLLELLAVHPSTARHLSHKLCERFVSDDAPDGCVDHATAAYLRSRGDIATVLRAIVGSDDFWAAAVRRTKVKSPLEFVLSAMRVTGASPDSSPRLAGVLQQLGQPLFQQQVPTGYPETQESWVNSGALLGRMNVAMALASGRMPGAFTDLDFVVPLTGDKDALVARVNATILGGQASANTLRVLRAQINDMNDPRMARAMAVGLALGSPEFQRQ